MAYTFKHFSIQPLGTPAADDLSSAAVHSFSYIIQSQIEVSRILATVSTVTVGASVITFRKRPTPGSSSGQSTIGTLAIPGATAVGKVLYKDVTLLTLEPGCEVIFEITTAATSGGCVYGFEANEDPESAGNQTAMIASA